MNYEELQKAIVTAKPAAFDAPASTPALSAREQGLISGIAQALEPYLKRIEQLEQRIAELERRPELKYLGVFRDDGRKYSEGSAITCDGGIWIALKATTERPGHSADWQLGVKSGDHLTPRSDASATSRARNGSAGLPANARTS